MGIWGFVGSTSEAVKRNVSDATAVKNDCRNSSYGTAAFTKIGEALVAPVKNACQKSYECGAAAFAKIDHTVRTKGRHRTAADQTNVNYELIIPAEEVEMERGGLDACANSSYGTAAFTKIGEALAAPVKNACRKSYECGAAAFANIDHTVRTKGCRRTAADQTNANYELIIPAEEVEMERGGLDACANSCTYGTAALAKIGQAVATCRISHTYGFIIFAKIGYTVRVKGVYRIVHWMSADGTKSTICIYTTNFAQNDDELHDSEEGCKLIPGQAAWAPVKNECRNFYTIDFITFAKIGYTVRVKVVYRIGQWMADDDNKARMIMYTTILAKNIRLYALQHGCKLIPGGVAVAVFTILSNTFIDVINEHQKLSKEVIPGEEMHGDGVKSVSNDGNASSSAANGSLKDEARVFVKDFLIFMVKEVIGFMRKEPFRTQLFSKGAFGMESLAFMMREIFCVYMKQHFGAKFISQMDEFIADIWRELFGAEFLNDLGFHESASKGKKTKKKKGN